MKIYFWHLDSISSITLVRSGVNLSLARHSSNNFCSLFSLFWQCFPPSHQWFMLHQSILVSTTKIAIVLILIPLQKYTHLYTILNDNELSSLEGKKGKFIYRCIVMLSLRKTWEGCRIKKCATGSNRWGFKNFLRYKSALKYDNAITISDFICSHWFSMRVFKLFLLSYPKFV